MTIRSIPLVLLAACTAVEPDSSGFLIEVTLSDSVSTVPLVTWELEDGTQPDAAWVEVGGLSVAVDLTSSGPWESAVLGLAPDQDYTVKVVAEIDGETVTSDGHALSTGSVSNQLPVAEVELYDDAEHADGYLVTSIYASPPAAVILNSDGEYVWWHIEEDTSFQISRARLLADRSEVLYWTENVRDGGAEQELVRVSAAGEELQRISLPDGHHDFLELADGRIAFLEHEESSGVQGDRVSVLDLETAETEVVWSVFDDIDTETESAAERGEGWSHANTLQTDGEDLYVNFLGFEGFVKIDLSTQEMVWAFGGVLSDFTTSSGSTELLERPHGFQILADSVLCFDNGDQERRYSRVLEYSLDEDEPLTELIWSYTPSPSAYTFSLGDVHRLSTGQTLMAIAIDGQVDEVDADGELLWRLNMELGGALGYTQWIESLYGPR